MAILISGMDVFKTGSLEHSKPFALLIQKEGIHVVKRACSVSPAASFRRRAKPDG